MDVTSLRAVVQELKLVLVPSRFERAQQPGPQTLQLGWRTLEGLLWLELSWQADCPRLVRVASPQRLGENSTLAQQLQHGLRQMALVDLEQPGFERVVQFGLAPRLGQPIERCLVLELMGRHSNLLLLDRRKHIIAIGRRVREHQSRIRPMGTGDIYVPPPPLKGLVPNIEETVTRWRARLELLPVNLCQSLQQTYQGISPSLALQLAGEDKAAALDLLETPVTDLRHDQWQYLYLRWLGWLHYWQHGRFRIDCGGPTPYRVWLATEDEANVATSGVHGIALALGDYYRRELNDRALLQQAKNMKQKLCRLQEKEEKACYEQKQRLEATEKANSLQQRADALLCIMRPSREEIDTAQALYRQARRLRRAVAALEGRLQYHHGRLRLIQDSYSFLEGLMSAEWEDSGQRLKQLQDLHEELGRLVGQVVRSKHHCKSGQKTIGTPSPLELRTKSGLRLQVGRNHRQNDWISLRQARSGDLWFHAQECSGSHVVLKTSEGLAQDDDLQLAADLAAYFSRARGNVQVPVVVVPTEHLQRITGGAPGTVRHHGGSVCWGEPDRGQKHLCRVVSLAS
ncbi:hypothetical protein OMCYN_00273 [cyanobiont of Ornithocercus magnificus]|nr:hypothetical protein OMCYN_00273 [cyanobiont of Ornithocercus magnificus]